MSEPTSRRSAFLDGTVGIGLTGPVLAIVAEPQPELFTWTMSAAIAATVAAWIVWRRAPRLQSAAAIAFAVFASVVLILGGGPLAFGAAWVACLALARSFGGRVALYYTAALSLTAFALHAATGSSWQTSLIESVFTGVLAGFGTAFALVLDDADRVERERALLSAEREATLASLKHANDELQRRLGTEQDLALAEERARTARDLHDGLGHRLTAIGLSLEYMQRMRDRDPERAWSELARARASVSEALEAMRTVVRAMHPVELATLRGTDAFSAIADAFRSSGLDIRVTVDGVRELSHEHSVLLVRFIQEGLTNVVRHADAGRVDLNVAVQQDGIEASIEDLGRLPAAPASDGFGLRSLRARAESLGGSLHAAPAPTGFLLKIALPAHCERTVAA
ncbi:sensor histidine kinase [Glycomyces sp. NRRL B-16210]|uniref:sensor histidine kinase n=1 Tax=Glycomyces sp. NRRL B-16210 TaxID=1463821 RepID=UPI00068988E3|nr:sensor histidine kinase [Glycomyces sp. NRRL B-16210]